MTQLPDFLKTSQAPRLAERTIQNLGAPTPPYLSIKGNKFTEIDATGAEEPAGEHDKATNTFYYDCLVVDTLETESKIYYDKPYDPSKQSFSPPDCWSDNGVAPSRNASVPQHSTCSGCPKAEWGSAVSKVSGKGIPACGKYQKLALLPVPLMEGPEQMLFLLRVPPNSLSNLRDYLAKFRGQEFDLKDVITRIQFAPDQIGTLTFRATNFIEKPMYEVREQMYAKKATDILVGRGDQPRGGALPSMAPAQQLEHKQDGADPLVNSSAHGAAMTQPQQTAAPVAATAPAAEAPKRRGRPKAQAEPTATTSVADTPAPFRAEPTPQPNGPAGNFGIQQGVPADADLANTLKGVFG